MGTIINISITGFVGNDPQVREVGEQRVASFSVAVNRKVNDQQQTLWVRVNCWNRLCEIAEQFVHRGSLVSATAEWMRPSAWIDQSGNPQASMDINANRLILLDRAKGEATEVEDDAIDDMMDVPF